MDKRNRDRALTDCRCHALDVPDDISAFAGLFANHWLWTAIALSVALQVSVVYVPVLQKAFGTVGLGAGDWLRCIGIASSVLWVRELGKLFARSLGSSGDPLNETERVNRSAGK